MKNALPVKEMAGTLNKVMEIDLSLKTFSKVSGKYLFNQSRVISAMIRGRLVTIYHRFFLLISFTPLSAPDIGSIRRR